MRSLPPTPPVLNSALRSLSVRWWKPQLQVRRVRLRQQAERIDVGTEVAARTVGRDQAADLALALVAGTGGYGDHAAGGLAAGLGDVVDDGRMRHVTGFAALEAVEVGLPFGVDTVGGNQVLLVQVLDEGGIGAELGGLGELLQETVHDGDRETLVGKAE